MSNYQINYCKDKSGPTIKWHAMMIYGRFHIVVLIGSLSYMSISTFIGEKSSVCITYSLYYAGTT